MQAKPDQASEEKPTQMNSREDKQPSEVNNNQEYNLHIEYFAGTVILFIGIMVLLTLIIAEMPQNIRYAAQINGISSLLYIAAGGFLLYKGYQKS